MRAKNQIRWWRMCCERWFETGGNEVAAMQERAKDELKKRERMGRDWFSFDGRKPDVICARKTGKHTSKGRCEGREGDSEGRARSNSCKESEKHGNFGEEVE